MTNVAAWIRGPKQDLQIEEAEYYQVYDGEILIEVIIYRLFSLSCYV